MSYSSTAAAVQPISGGSLLNFKTTGPWASLIPAGQTQLALATQREMLESILPIFEAAQSVPANIVLVQQIIAALKVVNGQL